MAPISCLAFVLAFLMFAQPRRLEPGPKDGLTIFVAVPPPLRVRDDVIGASRWEVVGFIHIRSVERFADRPPQNVLQLMVEMKLHRPTATPLEK
jgi:hypothetical protein